MIDLKPEHFQEVARILNAQGLLPYAWVHGSRAKRTAKPYSDLDILIKAPQRLTLQQQAALSAWFRESNLPFKVDVVDWYALAPDFQEAFESDAKAFIPTS